MEDKHRFVVIPVHRVGAPETSAEAQDSRWAARPGLRVRSPTASRNPGNATSQLQDLPEKRTRYARTGTAGSATAAALLVTTEWTSGSEARNCEWYAVLHRTNNLIDAHRFPKNAVHLQISQIFARTSDDDNRNVTAEKLSRKVLANGHPVHVGQPQIE
jgi:hypothetical protein